jgi:hypothetical protein
MDEEDGRPGPATRQFGPADVLMDACTESLCNSQFFIHLASIDLPHRQVHTQNHPRAVARGQSAPPQVAIQDEGEQ